jgi:hypothetical protein
MKVSSNVCSRCARLASDNNILLVAYIVVKCLSIATTFLLLSMFHFQAFHHHQGTIINQDWLSHLVLSFIVVAFLQKPTFRDRHFSLSSSYSIILLFSTEAGCSRAVL